MPTEPSTSSRPVHRLGLAFASACLGTIALGLFFLPILSIPTALAGLLVGLAALATKAGRASVGLRWAVAGVLVSGAVATFETAIVLASTGETADLNRPAQKSAAMPELSIPPPARPGHAF